MNITSKPVALFIAVIVIVGAVYYFESQKVHPTSDANGDFTIVPRKIATNSDTVSANSEDAMMATSSDTMHGSQSMQTPPLPAQYLTSEEKKKKYELAKEISTPDGFINTDSSFTIQNLIGKKVILVDFWTYSCINCQRTQPYLNAWYQKYKNEGLEIVGVHTPEFEFEKKYDNVKMAVERENIKYPVVLDNDYSTWRAYKNNYWPRKYLIDIDGYIVYDHIGEGAYDETEQEIQKALAERMHVLGLKGSVASGIANPQDAVGVDTSQPQSPEIYFGSARSGLVQNGVSLFGDWNIAPEYAESKGEASITYTYRGKNVYIVASSPDGVTAEIYRDGALVGSAGGKDVLNGTVMIKDEKLYHLISDPAGYGTHTIEIRIPKAGFRAFTFTFG